MHMTKLKRSLSVIFIALPLLTEICSAEVLSRSKCNGILSPGDLKNLTSDGTPQTIREKGPLAVKFWSLIQTELMLTKMKFAGHPSANLSHQIGGIMGYILNNELVIANLNNAEFQVQVVPLANPELAGFSDNNVTSFHLAHSDTKGTLSAGFQVSNHLEIQGHKSLMNYSFSAINNPNTADPSEALRKLDEFSFCFGQGHEKNCYEVKFTRESLLTSENERIPRNRNLIRVTRQIDQSTKVTLPEMEALPIVVPANPDSDLFLTFATLRWHSRTDRLPTLFVYLENMKQEPTTGHSSTGPLRDRFFEVAISLDALIYRQGSLLRHISKNNASIGASLQPGALHLRFP